MELKWSDHKWNWLFQPWQFRVSRSSTLTFINSQIVRDHFRNDGATRTWHLAFACIPIGRILLPKTCRVPRSLCLSSNHAVGMLNFHCYGAVLVSCIRIFMCLCACTRVCVHRYHSVFVSSDTLKMNVVNRFSISQTECQCVRCPTSQRVEPHIDPTRMRVRYRLDRTTSTKRPRIKMAWLTSPALVVDQCEGRQVSYACPWEMGSKTRIGPSRSGQIRSTAGRDYLNRSDKRRPRPNVCALDSVRCCSKILRRISDLT